jgi:hypothetical protein
LKENRNPPVRFVRSADTSFTLIEVPSVFTTWSACSFRAACGINITHNSVGIGLRPRSLFIIRFSKLQGPGAIRMWTLPSVTINLGYYNYFLCYYFI